MKYIEAEEQIKALSNKYSVDELWGYFAVNYKGTEIACVGSNERYVYDIRNKRHFQKLPFSNKLYFILAELAITPLDERVEEKKYYVKIFDGGLGYLNIDILTGDITAGNVCEADCFKTKFTNKAIKQLKQRDDISLDWKKVILEDAEEILNKERGKNYEF